MRNNHAYLFVLAVCAFLAGCVSVNAPRGKLPTATEAPASPSGGWLELQTRTGIYLTGELIHISPDTVYLFLDRTMYRIPKDDVERITLAFYDSQYSNLAAWTTVGSLSTISHGFFLIGSLPLWILTGSLSTSSHSRGAVKKFPKESWEEISKYARFPYQLENLSILHTIKK